MAKLLAVFLLLARAAALLPARRLASPQRGARPTASGARQMQQRSSVQMGLFGLGVPEIAVIVGIAGFVLGPEQLTSMAKDFGKIAGELKDVPKEFAEGMKETEKVKPKAIEGAKDTDAPMGMDTAAKVEAPKVEAPKKEEDNMAK